MWDASEYEKLPAYDRETIEQPTALFYCHQQDGRLYAGWAGAHDMTQNLAVDVAAVDGRLTPETLEQLMTYTSPVLLHATGAAAAAHGMTAYTHPGPRATRAIDKLTRKTTR